MKIKVALLTLLTLGTLSLANATPINVTVGEGGGAGAAAKSHVGNISGNAVSSSTISEFVDYSLVSSGPALGGAITATPNVPVGNVPDGGSTVVMFGVALCGLVFMVRLLKDTRVAAKRIRR